MGAYTFVGRACYNVKGGDPGVHQGGATQVTVCTAVCGGGVQEGLMLLARLSVGFQSLPSLPSSKLVPSGADSHVGVFVYVLGPCGSLEGTLL